MSCADVQTIQSGNGSKTQFSFDFPYIFKSEIHVYFWNATTKEWDEKLTTDATYPWRIDDANPTIVEFTSTAPPAPATTTEPNEPADVDNVKIRRITNTDDIRALFNPGSAIRSDDLNKNFEQLRYALQEANCPGVPEDVEQYLKDYYWDKFDRTIYSASETPWVSDDDKVATTEAIDNRVDAKIDTAITTDITGADGIDVRPNTSNGTTVIGIQEGGIDFIEIAEDAIVTNSQSQAEIASDPDQNSGESTALTDNTILTGSASEHRYRNYYQQATPSTGNALNPLKGQFWLRPGADPNDPNSTTNTLSMWDGANWIGVASGGTFTNQPTTIYVDRYSGDDVNNDGRRIIHQVRTIERALELANDGDMISVAPGVYQENLPLNIRQKNLSIIGDSIRSVFIQPKQANEYEMVDDLEYTDEVKNPSFNSAQPESPTNLRWISQTLLDDPNGTPPSNPNYNQTVESNMFRLNSGTYIANMTFVGMKASGSRGYHPIDNHVDYGLPEKQGWIFGLMPGCYIAKSPYIQNCTNFSDSAIDNSEEFDPSNSGFDPDTNQARPGYAGDDTSSPTGGAIIVDGSVPNVNSPLRSVVADSFTQVGLNGPGILVCNNGYTQLTSSYAFFTHYHLKALNGGQANLAASTTDFGNYGLIADGKSSSTIFTSTAGNQVSNSEPSLAYGTQGAHNITINAPTASTGWFGSVTRPQPNMLIEIGSDIYPIISSTGNGSGWNIKISNPNQSNKSINDGLKSDVAPNTTVNFYLRSMIASSGHTMEYVGSGTDYNALPENGGAPIESNQIAELNQGKIWAVTVDHKGKLKAGEDFAVDQESGAVLLGTGTLAIPTLITDLDVNGQVISDGVGNIQINKNVDLNSKKIVELGTPTDDADAATKLYTDGKVEIVGTALNSAVTQNTSTTGGVKTVVLDVNSASTTAVGVVQLSDSTNDTSTSTAATANAVKTAYDLADTANNTANAALPKAGGAMSGDIDLNQNVSITFDDGQGAGSAGSITGITDTTNTASSTVVASATAVKAAYDLADAALPKAGGTMTGNIDLNGNDLVSVGAITTTGNITIGGNLQVEGTTTTVNSTEITIDDKNITLGSIVGEDFVGNTTNNSPTITNVSNDDFAKVIQYMLVTGNGVPANTYIVSTQTVNNVNQVTLSNNISGTQQNVTFSQPGPSNAYSDGGGITVKGTSDKTFNFVSSNLSWTSSENIDLASGKAFKIAGSNVLSGSTLGSGVTDSSLTSVGTIATGVWNGTAIGVDYGGTGQTSYTDGQLLIGNSNGNTLSKATITGGNGVTVTNGNGSINLDVDLKANGGLVIESTELALDLGATSITGTLGTGDGGTGISTAPSQTQVLVGNSSNGYDLRTFVAGTNTTVDTSTAGQIAINATDTNTTYTAGDGIALSTTEFSVDLNGSSSGLEFIGGKLQADDSIARATGDTFTGVCTFNDNLFLGVNTSNILSTLAFKELSGSNHVGFKAPNTIATSIVWTLPDADGGKAGDVLTTDANGTLSWGRVLAGGGTDRVFFENDKTINTVYTITTGKNAMSAGPITVQPGATPIVPSGSTWTIV